MLWKRLRRNAIGFHFRRQHPVGKFVLDFYCDAVRLCVEVDGIGHERWGGESDKARDEALAQVGVLTLRFTNEEVGANLAGCLEKILFACVNRSGMFERAQDAIRDGKEREAHGMDDIDPDV